MFEDEYDLAIAVILGMEARSKRWLPTGTFKFNSGLLTSKTVILLLNS